MKILQTTREKLIQELGEPMNGCWDISHNDNWIEISPHEKPGLYKVNSLLSFFTDTINEEIAFINYFQSI